MAISEILLDPKLAPRAIELARQYGRYTTTEEHLVATRDWFNWEKLDPICYPQKVKDGC